MGSLSSLEKHYKAASPFAINRFCSTGFFDCRKWFWNRLILVGQKDLYRYCWIALSFTVMKYVKTFQFVSNLFDFLQTFLGRSQFQSVSELSQCNWLEAIRQLFYGKNAYRISISGKCGYVLTNGLTHLNCLLNFHVNFTINFSIKAILLAFGFAIDCQSLTDYNSLAKIHMLELLY